MAEASSAALPNAETNKHDFINNKKSLNLPDFTNFDLFCILLGFISFVADICTDVILIVDYLLCGRIDWAISTFVITLIPAVIVQFYSLKWYKLDGQITSVHYILHVCLFGVVYRYIIIIHSIVNSRLNRTPTNIEKLFRQQNDLCTLHLFECFIESTPQIVLQFYIILNNGNWYSWAGLSVGVSICSLIWAIASYTKIRKKQITSLWHVLILQTTWQYSMLLARIASLVLFAVMFHYWVLLVIGLHWICMFAWIVIVEESSFFPIIWEDRFYDSIVSVVYCFSYFNICEGCSSRKVFIFYTTITLENIVFFVLATVMYKMEPGVVISCTVLILGATIIGIICLTVYFWKFHPTKTVSMCCFFQDMETNPRQTTSETIISNETRNPRSSVHLWTVDRRCSGKRNDPRPRGDDVCHDKKLLLENWIGRSGTPTFASVPISQSPVPSGDFTFRTEAEETPKSKRWKDISATEKRRAICCSDQLVSIVGALSPLTNRSNDEEVCLKRRPIYSIASYGSDLNPKYLLRCSIAETPSEVLSAHDYENMCAVNIARERWGLRSWEGYTDIETYLHDDSTVRDRRRDTLTSTLSSEISSDVASSSPNRKTRLGDYLDALALDLHFYDDQDGDSTIFVIDQHVNSFFPVMETIEEAEEISATPPKLQSRSSLVTTIEEISKGDEIDSPRHVYHRTENHWDDDVPQILPQRRKLRRKFSLLRDRFEPKCRPEQLEMGSTINLIDDLKATKASWRPDVDSCPDFIKQVLSPPKRKNKITFERT